MDERESRVHTIGMGCFALASIVLFVVVYSPLLGMSGPRASIRPMGPLPLLAAVLAWGGWLPCVATGVRQLFVRPRVYGVLTIGIGGLQIAAYRLAEWVLLTSRGLEWGS